SCLDGMETGLHFSHHPLDFFMPGFHMSDLFGVRRIRLGCQRIHQHDGGYEENREDRKYLTKHSIPSFATGLIPPILLESSHRKTCSSNPASLFELANRQCVSQIVHFINFRFDTISSTNHPRHLGVCVEMQPHFAPVKPSNEQ